MAVRSTGILPVGLTVRPLLRHGRVDRRAVGLALAMGAVEFSVLAGGAVGALPAWSISVWVACAVWWCSNTIAHCHVHTPFFVRQGHNRVFSLYLTGILGLPQSVWRARHLWHHAGEPPDRRPTVPRPWLALEIGLVLSSWAAIAWLSPALFLRAWLPGWLLGLALCAVHGHFEHAGAGPRRREHPGISCYRRLYNLLWFNDGYHAEHHRRPGRHWSRLPRQRLEGAGTSAWPPVLRWLDALGPAANSGIGRLLDHLEGMALRSPRLQAWLIDRHAVAIGRALSMDAARMGELRRATVIGGGLFPRTVLALRRILPDLDLQVVDADPGHIAAARRCLAQRGMSERGIVFREGEFAPPNTPSADLMVFPLAFRGDRDALYRRPPARHTLVHDWLWRRRGRAGVIVSPLLLKRLNVAAAPRENRH